MAYRKQVWRDYDDRKTEVQNLNDGAVVTPERMNHIETGVANAAERAELEQTKQEVTSQLAQRATKQELEVERLRINSLSQLEEGSTTGDAELMDIRIGIDGTVYETAGEAVRNVLTPYLIGENEEWIL